MEPEKLVWHPEVLCTGAEQTLASLVALPAVKSFYLGGGTALALQWGHRKSVDLDFFSGDPVNENALLAALRVLPEVSVIAAAAETLHLHIASTKVSFLGYHYPMLFPLLAYQGVAVADPRDIGAMKISAIASRSTRRDFIDLYVLAERYGLDEIIGLFSRKFVGVDYNIVHILKSLTYFADADKEPMPEMLSTIPWERIKQFFVREALRIRERL